LLLKTDWWSCARYYQNLRPYSKDCVGHVNSRNQEVLFELVVAVVVIVVAAVVLVVAAAVVLVAEAVAIDANGPCCDYF
jgi:hypothetical protein